MNNSEKSVTRCKKTFCPKFILRQKQLTEKLTKNLTRKVKGGHKNKELEKLIKNIIKSTRNNKTLDKKMLEGCIMGYCNPSCKNTIFQAGSKMTKSLEAQIKKEKHGDIVLDILKKTRKNIFGNKKNVLTGDFYKDLPKDKVEKIQKQGAISGCTVSIL
jgi:uracil phosphoribosyltransferase